MFEHLDINTINSERIKLSNACYYNIKRRMIVRENKEIFLKFRDNRALEYLVVNNGNKCQVDLMYRYVWNEEFKDPNTKTRFEILYEKSWKDPFEDKRILKRSIPNLVAKLRGIIGDYDKKIIETCKDDGDIYLNNYVLRLPDEQEYIERKIPLSSENNKQDVINLSSDAYFSRTDGVISFESEEKKLTSMEYKILCYLIDMDDEWQSYEKIYNNCWDDEWDEDKSGKLIDHIVNIRKKIKDKNKTIIINVDRMGYGIKLPNNDVIKKGLSSDNKIYFTNDYYYDCKAEKIYCKEEQIMLKPQEKKVLMYLLDNNERFCLYEEIASKCWGEHNASRYEEMTDRLRDQITLIRKKIGDHNRTIIENRKYIGYKINIKSDC